LWISKLQVINVKSFADSGLLQLSKGINVIVGKNNAGKSTLLQCVLSMQSTNQSHPFNQAKEARRIGTSESTIRITLQDIGEAYFNMQDISEGGQGDLTIARAFPNSSK
jgi:recombinational DNA repair ATPase RecF